MARMLKKIKWLLIIGFIYLSYRWLSDNPSIDSAAGINTSDFNTTQ